MEAVAAIADAGTFRAWGALDGPVDSDIPQHYREQLARATAVSGTDESVVAGELAVGGVPCAVLAWEFRFLGGSVGRATARRIVGAVRRATREGRPVVALPCSGGTRMQEGAPAFVQMAAITAALAEHRRAGLPYLVHLRDPVTGGVLATLGSMGDRTTAEPGAMVGFLGPRAVRAIAGRELPTGVQTAENLARVGLIDEVVPTERVRDGWALLLQAWRDRGLAPHRRGPDRPAPPRPTDPQDLWDRVVASRGIDRPGAPDVIDRYLPDLVELPATGPSGEPEGVRVGVGRLLGGPVVVVATTDRRTGAPLTVAGLRGIRRGLDLATRWGLPVVSLVDTLGAQLDRGAEESGIAREVARTTLAFTDLPVPSATLLIGPGTGGAALPMLAADRVVATAGSWVSPLAPEGAVAIRPVAGVGPVEAAWQQGIGVHALADVGVVDRIVPDDGPDWLQGAVDALGAALADACAGDQRRVSRFEAWT